jgi:hypothetical protein
MNQKAASFGMLFLTVLLSSGLAYGETGTSVQTEVVVPASPARWRLLGSGLVGLESRRVDAPTSSGKRRYELEPNLDGATAELAYYVTPGFAINAIGGYRGGEQASHLLYGAELEAIPAHAVGPNGDGFEIGLLAGASNLGRTSITLSDSDDFKAELDGLPRFHLGGRLTYTTQEQWILSASVRGGIFFFLTEVGAGIRL